MKERSFQAERRPSSKIGRSLFRYNRNIVGSPVIETIRGNELVESVYCKQGGTAMRRPCLAMGDWAFFVVFLSRKTHLRKQIEGVEEHETYDK